MSSTKYNSKQALLAKLPEFFSQDIAHHWGRTYWLLSKKAYLSTQRVQTVNKEQVGWVSNSENSNGGSECIVSPVDSRVCFVINGFMHWAFDKGFQATNLLNVSVVNSYQMLVWTPPKFI